MPASRPPEPRSGTANPTALLVIICVTYFMVILDNSIIFTGLPSIEAGLHFSPAGLTWVQDAYTLVFGGLLLLGARAGDIVGRRRMFTIGLVIFSLASLLVGAAPAQWWLIAARAIQGVGAAILAPASLALLTAGFPEGRARARAVAAYSAVAGIGASLGLVIGGVLADQISWRAGFYLNVPIGIVMLALAGRYIPAPRAVPGHLDLTGALCGTLGMSALVFGIIETSSHEGFSPSSILALVLGLLLLALFVLNEKRAEQPIMPLHLFADRRRNGAYLVRMLYLGAMIGFFFFTTQFLQGVRGYSPLEAGVAFLPMTAVNFAIALLVNRVIDGFGSATVLVAGVAATLIGMAWLSRVDISSAYVTGVALPMVLIGLGQGLAFAPMTSYGLAGTTPADAGAASGVVNTAHQLGSALGLGILVAVSTTVGDGSELLQRVTTALTGSSVYLAVGLVLTLALIALPTRNGQPARRNPVEVRTQDREARPAGRDVRP